MVQKQEDYLSKAEEADDMAEKAQSLLAQDTWRKIAKNYRDLASLVDAAPN